MTVEPISDKKNKLRCECGFSAGCRIGNDGTHRCRHIRHVLRTWE